MRARAASVNSLWRSRPKRRCPQTSIRFAVVGRDGNSRAAASSKSPAPHAGSKTFESCLSVPLSRSRTVSTIVGGLKNAPAARLLDKGTLRRSSLAGCPFKAAKTFSALALIELSHASISRWLTYLRNSSICTQISFRPRVTLSREESHPNEDKTQCK